MKCHCKCTWIVLFDRNHTISHRNPYGKITVCTGRETQCEISPEGLPMTQNTEKGCLKSRKISTFTDISQNFINSCVLLQWTLYSVLGHALPWGHDNTENSSIFVNLCHVFQATFNELEINSFRKLLPFRYSPFSQNWEYPFILYTHFISRNHQ